MIPTLCSTVSKLAHPVHLLRHTGKIVRHHLRHGLHVGHTASHAIWTTSLVCMAVGGVAGLGTLLAPPGWLDHTPAGSITAGIPLGGTLAPEPWMPWTADMFLPTADGLGSGFGSATEVLGSTNPDSPIDVVTVMHNAPEASSIVIFVSALILLTAVRFVTRLVRL